MSKAILILEKHEHCIDCPLLDGENYTCVVTGGYVERMIRKEDRREIPCPLKPMQNKRNNYVMYENATFVSAEEQIAYLCGYEDGWNDYINELVGEEE